MVTLLIVMHHCGDWPIPIRLHNARQLTSGVEMCCEVAGRDLLDCPPQSFAPATRHRHKPSPSLLAENQQRRFNLHSSIVLNGSGAYTARQYTAFAQHQQTSLRSTQAPTEIE